MTKLSDILNDYYVTEGITVTKHIKEICSEVAKIDREGENNDG